MTPRPSKEYVEIKLHLTFLNLIVQEVPPGCRSQHPNASSGHSRRSLDQMGQGQCPSCDKYRTSFINESTDIYLRTYHFLRITLPMGLHTLPAGWVPSLRSVCSNFSKVPFSPPFPPAIMVKLVANSSTLFAKHSSVIPGRPSGPSLQSLKW